MLIDYLLDHPDFIATLAREILAHWSKILPDGTIVTRRAKLQSHLNRDALRIAWVAHAGGTVLGTAALRVHDLEGREDRSPWLGGVFVREPYRGRGIGTALTKVVEAKAWALGMETLYLFTTDQQRLYAQLGWK